MNEAYVLGAGEIFTLFFVMLGPLKMLGPFAKASREMSKAEIRKLSLEATLFAFFALITGGFIGAHLMKSWHIPAAIMSLAGGVIFLCTALMFILAPQKASAPKDDEHLQALKPAGVVYSMIVTPYGMAVIISLLALSGSEERTLLVCGLLLVVMILNLLAMICIRQLMGKIGSMIMQMLGAVLGVLQAAFAMAIVFSAIKLLGPLW